MSTLFSPVPPEVPPKHRTGYFDIRNLPLTKLLEDNWEVIRDECDHLFEIVEAHPKPNSYSSGQHGKNPQEFGQPMMNGEVRSLYLRVIPELLDDNEKEICFAPGVPTKRVWRQRQCPKTRALLDSRWFQLGNIGFNRMWPGARINPHYGVSTRFFRVHLGLRTDPGCTFYLKEFPSYTWSEGKTMAFADGDVLHWVEHNGQQPRTILSIDVLKSELLKAR